MDIAKLWQICLDFEYDQALLVSSLAQWIDGAGGNAILDAACGTGFPALDLLRLGYQITCSDGSETMLREFRLNAKNAGLTVKPHHILWQDLAKHFTDQFDIIFCRGSSLIYAGTWEGGVSANKAAICEALQNFHTCLRKNGILYVDTTSEHNLTNIKMEHRQYYEKVVRGQKATISESVETDKVRNIRTWQVQAKVDNCVYEFERKSYFLPHEELLGMLREIGFKEVTRCNLVGEHYTIFIAHRC
jgi:SAM-dependent methyltransferase